MQFCAIHEDGLFCTSERSGSNTYDELGQLIGKNVGNTIATPLQKVNYAYNIRGWLTGVNNDPTNNLVLNTGEKDLFGFKINYNTVQNETGYTGKSLYNGNISETYWRASSDNILRKYGYKYDNLNRLRESIYQKPGNSNPVPKSYDENLTYDKNGNILSLLRNGAIDGALPPNNIDNLVYTYASNANKLLSVLDTSNNNIAGFVDANKSGDDYTYDANGNLITDKNKNITAIVYNHLNLPTKITFGTTGNIVYIYNAAGQKLEKLVTIGVSPVVKTQYLGGFQYKDNILQFFPTAEGYVKNTNGIYSYVFNYTDHLGNVRLSYSDTSKNGLIETTEIVDESHYYPFGLKHSGYVAGIPDPNYKYKYNGKELQDELGLNMYDYGARNYDPALGRWLNIDPLAEIYHTDSPYAYVLDNPLSYIDPDGRRLVGVTKDDAKNVHDDINTVFADSKFDKVRGLFTRGEKNNKKAFDKIGGDALKDALSGLTGDDLALAELVTGAVNSSVEYKVEYVESANELSSEGQTAFNSAFSRIYTDNGLPVPNFPIRKGSDVAAVGGEGYNAPTANGSHSFILNDKNTKHGEGMRALTSFHEIFGHGVASGQKASDIVNNTNAIRSENLVRRVLQVQSQRDGSNHSGGKVANPSALPIIKN